MANYSLTKKDCVCQTIPVERKFTFFNLSLRKNLATHLLMYLELSTKQTLTVNSVFTEVIVVKTDTSQHGEGHCSYGGLHLSCTSHSVCFLDLQSPSLIFTIQSENRAIVPALRHKCKTLVKKASSVEEQDRAV